MTNYMSGPLLAKALQDEGIPYPEECNDVEVHLPVDGIMTIKFVVFVTTDMLAKIGRALTRVAEDESKAEKPRPEAKSWPDASDVVAAHEAIAKSLKERS